MVNQLWLGGVFMIQGVTDRIGHFVTHRHATGHRAFGGRQRNRSERKILLHSKNCENIILNKEKGWRLCEIVQIKPKRDGSWMLRPAWLILSPPAMARWNLRSESEINVSSENLWVKINV